MTASKPRVLLVDDNDIDNLITRRILELSGFATEIDVCNSGKGGLQYIESLISEPERLPDLIFLDINMPIVDGFVFLYEFEALAQRIDKEIDIVVLSSSNARQDLQRLQLESRVVSYMIKPLSLLDLDALKAR